jgi:hypothetical protein
MIQPGISNRPNGHKTVLAETLQQKKRYVRTLGGIIGQD